MRSSKGVALYSEPSDYHRSPTVASRVLKRTFDLVFSAFGLVVTLPLFAFAAVAIKLDSRGPVFYKSTRVGRLGKAFRLLKFRTMISDADRLGASSTADDDPRITRVGRILRAFKLDELPQVINVVKGEMSLVGPRPQVSWIVNLYDNEDRAALSVKPGIADYAFVLLPSEGEILLGSADPDKDYLERLHPEKMRLTREYVRKHSFWFDMKVLVDTVLLSFFGKALFFESKRQELIALVKPVVSYRLSPRG